jgi:hypothetical protein
MSRPVSHVSSYDGSKPFLRRIACALLLGAAASGCTHQPLQQQAAAVEAAPVSGRVAPSSTVQWNEFASELVARNRVGQFPALRTFAYVNLAISNAIGETDAKGVAAQGAAAGAASEMLVVLFPKEEAAIRGRLAAETAALGAGHQAGFATGVDRGRAAASDVVAMAKTDRASARWSGTVPTGAEAWSSLSTPPAPPLGAHLGGVRPFFMSTASEFRAPPPPALNSPEFQATLAEVRQIADTRTYEQLSIARHWENLTGPFSAGVWNEIARNAIAAKSLGEAESARLLAVMHMAGFDALLACHESKYTYWVPRPTQLDPQIQLAIGVPNHPSYPSNHACISGAMGLVLDAKFPDQRGRYFEMGRQAGESRIYAGIHYRIDVDGGLTIARKVAGRALETGVPSARQFVAQGQ